MRGWAGWAACWHGFRCKHASECTSGVLLARHAASTRRSQGPRDAGGQPAVAQPGVPARSTARLEAACVTSHALHASHPPPIQGAFRCFFGLGLEAHMRTGGPHPLEAVVPSLQDLQQGGGAAGWLAATRRTRCSRPAPVALLPRAGRAARRSHPAPQASAWPLSCSTSPPHMPSPYELSRYSAFHRL